MGLEKGWCGTGEGSSKVEGDAQTAHTAPGQRGQVETKMQSEGKRMATDPVLEYHNLVALEKLI